MFTAKQRYEWQHTANVCFHLNRVARTIQSIFEQVEVEPWEAFYPFGESSNVANNDAAKAEADRFAKLIGNLQILRNPDEIAKVIKANYGERS